MLRHKEIEKSIITKFRKEIWSKFAKAVSLYELIKENDKVMVCISGGKDSFLLAKCIEELKCHGKVKFEVKYVVMNPGYKKEVLDLIKENAKTLNLDVEIFNSPIFEIANNTNEKGSCYLCARMRRGYLYDKARKLGCNKIALGHHFNDVIETTLLSMFYSSEIKTMMPKLHSNNFLGLELIRPLYMVKECDIISWAKYNNLTFINCACDFTEREKNFNDRRKRKEMKELIELLKKNNKDIDRNIFTSMSNVNLNCVLGYSKNGKKINFLDEYDE